MSENWILLTSFSFYILRFTTLRNNSAVPSAIFWDAWAMSSVMSYIGSVKSFGPGFSVGIDLRKPDSWSNFVRASGQTDTGRTSDTFRWHRAVFSPSSSQDSLKKVGWSIMMVVSTTKDWKQISRSDSYFTKLTSFCCIFLLRNFVGKSPCPNRAVKAFGSVLDATCHEKCWPCSHLKSSQRVNETRRQSCHCHYLCLPQMATENLSGSTKRRRTRSAASSCFLPFFLREVSGSLR